MRPKLKFIWFLLVSTSCFVPCLSASQICAGGQPSYCGRQDFGSVYAASESNAPSAFYGAIGAGKIIIGPDFGERILRLTDALSGNLSDANNDYFDGNCGGNS